MTDITQDNLYLLLPSKVGRLATMLSDMQGIDVLEAMRRIYHSEMYRKLEIEKTKTWHEGPVGLYRQLSETSN
ncbi:hypothetical protein J6U78_05565 [bacterium]|jgi:hypothetical protein|nr:hypothetical protein [bacterium]MBR4465409.1 hypothetical protein [bacterium]